jgi:hypothetical protein
MRAAESMTRVFCNFSTLPDLSQRSDKAEGWLPPPAQSKFQHQVVRDNRRQAIPLALV